VTVVFAGSGSNGTCVTFDVAAAGFVDNVGVTGILRPGTGSALAVTECVPGSTTGSGFLMLGFVLSANHLYSFMRVSIVYML